MSREALDRFIRQAYADGSVEDSRGVRRELAPHSVELAEGEAIRDLVVAEGATRTIEVGLALGMSALFFCDAIAGREGAGHVAIDPFQEESWGGAGLETLRRAGVAELVEAIEEESALALPQLVREGRKFDLAFVDGDHRFESVLLDLVFMTRLVKPGGVIVVDDMWMPSVRLAVSYVERNLDLALEPDAIEGGFAWSFRPGRPRLWWRRLLRRGVPVGSGEMAVLRNPVDPPPRPWDRFDAFF